MARTRSRRALDDDNDALDAIERADGISYLPTDEAAAVPQPDTIAQGWHELEYGELAVEQKPLHTALGEKLARPFEVLAGRWERRSAADHHTIDVQKGLLDTAKARLDLVEDALHSYTRREPHAKLMYLLRWALLLLGDIAGIAGAAVLLGEIPSLAVLQAVASAIAAVTAGLVGNDIRDARLARRRARDPQELKPEHKQFAWLFSGADVGEKIVKAMVGSAVAVTLLVGVGIFTLRTGVEGGLGGAVFGCLAMAICLASAINSWNYTDEVADLLDNAYARYLRALRKFTRLSRSKAIARRDAATAEAASIKKEYEQLGVAAEHKYKALSHGIARNNPAVLGHGPAPRSPARRDEAPPVRYDVERPAEDRSANGARP